MLPYKAIEEFCEFNQTMQTYADGTYKNYTRALKRYADFLMKSARFEIENVDVYAIDQFLIRISKFYSEDTLYCTKIAIRNFHEYLTFKYDFKNPTEHVEVRLQKKRLPVYASHEEIERIMSYYDSSDDVNLYNKAILEMLYGTGVRISELANLTMNHVDLVNGLIKVRGKGDKDRIVPIPGMILEILIDYVNKVRNKWNTTKCDHLFVNRRGAATTANYIRVMTKHVVSQLEIQKNITPHKIRHTYATHLLEGGASILDISELLGHSNVSTTQIYTHVEFEKTRKIYNSAFSKLGLETGKKGFITQGALASLLIIMLPLIHILHC